MPLTTMVITGSWLPIDGVTATGYVELVPTGEFASTASSLVPAKPTDIKLVNGAILATLTSNAQVPGLQYQVTEHIDGAINPAPYVITPTGSSMDLSTAPRGATGNVQMFVMASSVGQVGGPAGPLTAGGFVPTGQLGSGTPTADTFLSGAETWSWPESVVFDARAHGVVADVVRLRVVTCSAGSPTVTVSSSVPATDFSTATAGKLAVVVDGNNFVAGTMTTIASANAGAGTITLAANAGITLSGGAETYLVYGTDDGAAWASAFAAAAAYVKVDTTIGPNTPRGAGKARIACGKGTIAGSYGSSWSGSIHSTQLSVPGGVLLDPAVMLFNGQTDRYNPSILVNSYGAVGQLIVDSLFGAGIQLGTAAGTQANVWGDSIEMWHVGTSTETTGLLRKQNGITLAGYSYIIRKIWMKGGVYGVYHNAGSDCSIDAAHIIGALTAVWTNGSNMAHYGALLVDTCGQVGGGTSGVVVDNGTSMFTFGVIKAFMITGSTKKLDNVLLIGGGGAGNNTQIYGAVVAQLTGGNVLNLAKAQDFDIVVLGSNTSSGSSGGSNLTTAVIYGASVAGGAKVASALNTSITAYSGTVAGRYAYTQGGVETIVEGRTAPAVAAQAGMGTTPPAITISGNDREGTITWGTGTGTAAGDQVKGTFNLATRYLRGLTGVQVSPNNAATAALAPYVNGTQTTFTVGVANAPAASQAAGTYSVSYRIGA